jgi:uncharacterized protein with HEPN domain
MRHMIEAVSEILEFLQGREFNTILNDRPLQHLIVRDLEILGEAASRVSQAYRQKHPEIPWRDMIGLRNRLIHVYFDLDLEDCSAGSASASTCARDGAA